MTAALTSLKLRPVAAIRSIYLCVCLALTGSPVFTKRGCIRKRLESDQNESKQSQAANVDDALRLRMYYTPGDALTNQIAQVEELMIPCINQATVLPADTLEFLAKASDVGFRLVELDITRLEEASERHGLARIRETLRDRQLQVVSLNAIENYPLLTNDELAASLSRCEEIFKLSRKLECSIVVLNPNEFKPAERRVTESAFDSFVDRAAAIASKFGVRLGYEFVSYENRVVNTLAASVGALSRWNHAVGLVLDVFHLYKAGEEISQIPDQLMDRFWIFHINDAPPIPIPDVKDADRVFPGEGVINIKQTLNQLAGCGFDGPVSLELFNSAYWERPVEHVLRKSWDCMLDLIPRERFH